MAYAQFTMRNISSCRHVHDRDGQRSANPFYETLAFRPTARRSHNAELGRQLFYEQAFELDFSPAPMPRPGWAAKAAGGKLRCLRPHRQHHRTTSGYAFSMNSMPRPGIYRAGGALRAAVRALTESLALARGCHAKSLLPNHPATNMQSSAAWVQQTGMQSISYEGVRHLGVTTPYATADAAAPIQD